VNTTVVIAVTISRTVVELAFIGAGLKLLLAIAPRFQIAAPKAPQVRVKVIDDAPAGDGQAPAGNGADPAKSTAVAM
jgi:hypothetical protein